MMIILVILLLMFGAKKLPELARGLGQAMKEFSKAKNDIHDEIMRDPAPTTQVVTQEVPKQIDQPGVQPQPAAGTQAQTAQAAPVQAAPAPAPVPAPAVTVEPPKTA